MAVQLNRGTAMPLIGLGTFKLRGDSLRIALDAALQANYRLIDTARVYRNETEVGAYLKELLQKYSCSRSDLFITSKAGPKDHGSGNCRKAVRESLTALGAAYIDLYLIHWPGVQGMKHDDPRQKKLRLESWRDLETLHEEGLVKAIGVSNYTVRHLEELLSECKIQPAVVQNEFHPHLFDVDLLEYCRKNDIQLQAYSSLGTSDSTNVLICDPVIKRVASETNKTPAQVLLKWSLQQNIGVIPKSTNPQHINENINLFDFTLTSQQMQDISSLNAHKHLCWNPADIL